MLVITVARKPLSTGLSVAKNSLLHGTGGINIDATRVGVATAGWGGGGRSPGGAVWTSNSCGMKEGEPRPVTGRWPANLILQHLPGCSYQGTKRVRGSWLLTSVNKAVYAVESITGFLRGQTIPGQNQHVDPDGLETVAAWDCTEGCPVADLDQQSGIRKSGTGSVKRSSAAEACGNRGPAYGRESRPVGTINVEHHDSGGASRFFKQVK